MAKYTKIVTASQTLDEAAPDYLLQLTPQQTAITLRFQEGASSVATFTTTGLSSSTRAKLASLLADLLPLAAAQLGLATQ